MQGSSIESPKTIQAKQKNAGNEGCLHTLSKYTCDGQIHKNSKVLAYLDVMDEIAVLTGRVSVEGSNLSDVSGLTEFHAKICVSRVYNVPYICVAIV